MLATYTRILASIPLVLCVAFGAPYSVWPAAVIFILASITDWLDGYLARKFNAESDMGKLMDPIADKIIVLSALIMLLWLERVDPYAVILLLGRDIYIGGIRSVAATQRIIIAAKPFGKWKTAFQMISIPCLLVYQPNEFFNLPIDKIGYFTLWVSVALSIVSAIQYTLGFYKQKASEP